MRNGCLRSPTSRATSWTGSLRRSTPGGRGRPTCPGTGAAGRTRTRTGTGELPGRKADRGSRLVSRSAQTRCPRERPGAQRSRVHGRHRVRPREGPHEAPVQRLRRTPSEAVRRCPGQHAPGTGGHGDGSCRRGRAWQHIGDGACLRPPRALRRAPDATGGIRRGDQGETAAEWRAEDRSDRGRRGCTGHRRHLAGVLPLARRRPLAHRRQPRHRRLLLGRPPAGPQPLGALDCHTFASGCPLLSAVGRPRFP
ncbi:hypothetical protein BX285_6611 [Streptomyces sp. 1114.5]|nr:hypothetical protein BX285_6611 [Streptomyces sp. 1114.5]